MFDQIMWSVGILLLFCVGHRTDFWILFGKGPGGWDSWDSWDGWDSWDSWDQQINRQLEVQSG